MTDKAEKLLRIYIDEAATIGDRKVFEHIVSLACERRLAGVTVLEALLGFGRPAHMHRHHVLASDRSVVIEFVDDDEPLRDFVASLKEVPDIGLVTLDAVEVIGGRAAPRK